MIKEWETTRNLHLEIRDYKQTINDHITDEDTEKFELSFHNDYLKFLDEASSSIKELKENLINNKFNL